MGRRDALAVDPATVPDLLAVPGAFGDYQAVRNEAEILEIREGAALVAGAGFASLAVAVAVGTALLLPALGFAVWVPIALPAGALGLWACLRALAHVRPASLLVDRGSRLVRGVSGGGWLPRQRWASAEQVEAVVLETRQVRPSAGSGQHSVAVLSVALRGGAVLKGPRSEERALASWAEARDQLLPLGLELSRRLGCPLRLRYLGWPDAGGPIERVVGAQA